MIIPIHLPKEATKVDPAVIIQLHKYLQQFADRAVKKFIAGQIEHGGNIEDRDCLNEAMDEVIDLVFYLSAALESKTSINRPFIEP